MLKGIPASDGIGIGRVMIIEEQSLDYTPKAVTDPEEESKRFRNAVDNFCNNKKAQAQALRKSTGEKEAEILEGHIEMIKDPYLSGEIEKLIAEGQSAESALEHMCDMFITMFLENDDELTQQRAVDVKDIKTGVLSILLGVNEVKISSAPKGTILVAKEITPSMTAGINRNNIAGIVTQTGSTTSHSAIISKALEIPAVLGVNNVTEMFSAGEQVIVDGSQGVVIASPTQSQIKEYTEKLEKFRKEHGELEKYRHKKTLSKSGEEYELFCNIGNPDEAIKSVECDGEGVGLFRTEFLFMNRSSMPTEDEQFEAYKKAAVVLKDKPLTIRTLDIGGDKELPYLGLKKEENPYMGFRAIRYCLKNREVFKTQIRAILRASAYGNVRIMFPLITTLDELVQSKKIVEEVKSELRKSNINYNENIKIGVMIETPSSALIVDLLAKESDFFSIGTNDLTGYTMSCDRGNSDVSYLYSAFQPSVLRLIKHIIECANRENVQVAMCGESASSRRMIPLLISFGLNEFSVLPASVLKVRKTIAKWSKEEADKVAEKVMSMTDEKEINEYLMSVR